MKLIVQSIDGALYMYRETEAHFKKVEPSRVERLDPTVVLDNQCSLGDIEFDNWHMVFDIKTKPRKRKK